MDQQIISIEQLVAGRLYTTDSTAAFGSVLMSRIASNLPALIRVPALQSWASYVLSDATGAIYCSGMRCGPEHCLVADSNVGLTLICPAGAEVILCRIGARPRVATSLQCGAYRLAGDAAAVSRIRAMIAALEPPLDNCATLSHKVSCADLRDSLAGLSLAPDTSAGCSSSHRTMAIERGRRYIHANLGGALRIASVCEAAGIRSRTLEYGFRELFGVSPVSYIKALRLNHVRRLLSSSASARRTITAIALDSGFWHLSQFAADYQKFFGESPSITRRRSLAQKPISLREARSASGF